MGISNSLSLEETDPVRNVKITIKYIDTKNIILVGNYLTFHDTKARKLTPVNYMNKTAQNFVEMAVLNRNQLLQQGFGFTPTGQWK